MCEIRWLVTGYITCKKLQLEFEHRMFLIPKFEFSTITQYCFLKLVEWRPSVPSLFQERFHKLQHLTVVKFRGIKVLIVAVGKCLNRPWREAKIGNPLTAFKKKRVYWDIINIQWNSPFEVYNSIFFQRSVQPSPLSNSKTFLYPWKKKPCTL